MDTENQIQWIESRKRKLAEEIDRLENELDELNSALKIIRQMRSDIEQVGGHSEPAKVQNSAEPATKLGPPRPEGIPTNFEMVDTILADAENAGRDGLSIGELIGEIRSRFWPGLEDVQVSAPIYAFVRKGRLRKTVSGKFKRLKKASRDNEAPIAMEGAS